MKIVAIETSCDETSIAVVSGAGSALAPAFSVLGEATYSQIALHKNWGGVVPNLAKREHSRNLLPVLETVLKKSCLLTPKRNVHTQGEKKESIARELLEREGNLSNALLNFTSRYEIPDIDLIAVTHGPGLEPALWVGINFAKALAALWDKPVMGINHMEGHILSVLIEKRDGVYESRNIPYPALALLISGGHTELVFMDEPLSYKILGETRDDAVGEAFDKVARILGLPYPGGPEISKLAETASHQTPITFPRPMLNSPDYDFSFSGLKTSVPYKTRELGTLTNKDKGDIAYQFEQAVKDVLLSKTKKAIAEFGVRTLIVSGGVSANKTLRAAFQKLIDQSYPGMTLLLPDKFLATDNAVMIGIAAYVRSQKERVPGHGSPSADGNLPLAKRA